MNTIDLEGEAIFPSEDSPIPPKTPIVTKSSYRYLNERQRVDYEAWRSKFIEWLSVFGKKPDRAKGYADTTVVNTAYRTDAFNRWVWDRRDGYTTLIDHDDADQYLYHLASTEKAQNAKDSDVKTIKRFMKWRTVVKGEEEWNNEINFGTDSGSTSPKDYLSRDERTKIRNAALEYASVPSYQRCTPQERDRWRRYISQFLGKPKRDVVIADWKRMNDWRIPSLVWTSLDTGLRPIEVKRAKVSWVDYDNAVLRIPKEDSAKNQNNWITSIKESTANSLERWLKQRENYPEYDDTDALWLNRRGNPYESHSLRHLIRRLFDTANIDYEHRNPSWYFIRRSVGTFIAEERGLKAAQMQLRHTDIKSTFIYDQAPVEQRRDALDRIG